MSRPPPDSAPPTDPGRDQVTLLRVHDLHLPITEAAELLAAIRLGEIDALVVAAPNEAPRVFLLKGADEAHRVLLETLNEGAMTIAPDGTILYANARLAEILERPHERVLGAALPRFLPPEDGALLARIVESHALDAKVEMTLFGDRGARVPVMMSLRAVGADREHYTAVVTDLSPLKRAEDALRRANDELEARVLARTAEIERVNAALRAEIAERSRLTEELSRKAEELAAADRRKDEFLSMLAHELRNPLAPIVASVELLRAAGGGSPKIERYRAIIERQTRNLTRLVEDLLDVSRITRGMIVLRPRPADLATLVASAVEAARPHIEAAGHELSVCLPERPIELHVDPTRFEQVLVNLLNNAAKYTERGGKISLSAEAEGDVLAIRVRDNGVGIPAELLPHVFELFVQGKRSLARSKGGLGLGLTLVKSLVDLHGGTCEARSEGPGRGTEMIVRFPLDPRAGPQRAPSDPQIMPEPRPSMPTHDAPIRLLVVEDNVDAGESLVELLELWGFDVCWAMNGEAALRVAAELRPHVSLIDIGLPGIDGYEVARSMRERLGDGAGVLIGLTGYGQQRDRERGVEAGFDHYLVKPLHAPHLQRILEQRGLDPTKRAA